MTEAEWLVCEDGIDMLLRPPGKMASDRKLRLFACACCRRIWDDMSEGNRSAVELAERYADGQASHEELAEREERCRIYWDIDELDILPEDRLPEYWCNKVAWCATMARAADGADDLCDAIRWMTGERSGEYEDVVQARLLREVLGNPFQPLTFAPSWRSPTVVALAQAIYDDRAFDLMPILADALEEASCDNTEILRHCRSLEPHVKGCWAVDLVLEKK